MSKSTPATTAESAKSPADANDDLRRYRQGEITEAEYLKSRVDLATSHLKGVIPEEDFELIQETIAQRLETDPVLVEARLRLLGPRSGARNRDSK